MLLTILAVGVVRGWQPSESDTMGYLRLLATDGFTGATIPAGMTITHSGRTHYTGTRTRLPTGVHHVKASCYGYESDSFSAVIRADETTRVNLAFRRRVTPSESTGVLLVSVFDQQWDYDIGSGMGLWLAHRRLGDTSDAGRVLSDSCRGGLGLELEPGKYWVVVRFNYPTHWADDSVTTEIAGGTVTRCTLELGPYPWINVDGRRLSPRDDSILKSLRRYRFEQVRSNRDDVPCRTSNDRKRKALQVLMKGSGKYALKQTPTTVEGDPVPRYLVVDKGRWQLVFDGSRDAFGAAMAGGHKVSVREGSRARLVHNRWDRDNQRSVPECLSPDVKLGDDIHPLLELYTDDGDTIHF
ncbi:MAG: hypothetical protein JSU73_06510 [candidate division WOR-3 bacterium]|nr:MAG: hypothetical protein JSU73_06510 [candidate division WOR-3 bacterium]